MNKSELEYRMYGWTPYQLTGIQQGIQFGHAAIEYSIAFQETPEYKKWSQIDKTFIIYNGGTTNNNPDNLGGLNEIEQILFDNRINYATFNEPDLGDQLTAVVMLVDERVWNRRKFPDFNGGYVTTGWGPAKPANFNGEYDAWKDQFGEDVEQILFLRDYLKNFRFA